ncbi:hypothetical protein A45J_0399 [hot springs metagenome]|uniref:Uncharacterized protein n=1 Tax=hot springs metagenome TaxID=433727 RepID=A0A5J4L1M2_9ZZZZ
MATVNSEIKRIIKEKDAGIRSGTAAMRDIIDTLRQQVQAALGMAAAVSWDAYYLKKLLDSLEYQFDNFTVKAKKEAEGLVEDIWGMGQSLVDAPLKLVGIYSGFHISTSVLDVMKDYTNNYLEGLFGDAWTKVRGEISLGMMGAKTQQEVAAAIGKNLKDKSIFSSIAERAEVIIQTEMGRAFSRATQYRMYQAAQYVPDLEKQWIHAGHPKQPRPSHLAAHGQHVPVKDAFTVGGIEMMHPRDPAAPVSETIRCG